MAVYSIFLFFLGLFLLMPRAYPILGLSLEGGTQFEIGLLILTIMATSVHWVASRRLIRFVGLQCPPVRQSLSRAPIVIIAYEVWIIARGVLGGIVPLTVEAPEDVWNGLLSVAVSVVPIVLGIAAYKLGVRLFVEQAPKRVHQAQNEEA